MCLKARRRFWCSCFILLAASSSRGVVSDKMDYGTFISYRVALESSKSPDAQSSPAARGKKAKKPTGPIVAKGVTVSLDAGTTICFDTDMLRYAAGWTGGFLDMTATNVGSKAGHEDAKPIGQISWSTGNVAGVTTAAGDFADPRPDKQGPLPRKTAHYRGLFKYADRVVFSYTVGDVGVYDLPGVFGSGPKALFTRTIAVEKSDVPMNFLLAEVDGATKSENRPEKGAGRSAAVYLGERATAAILLDVIPAGAKLTAVAGRIALQLPPHEKPLTLKVGLWSGAAENLEAEIAATKAAPPAEAIAPLLKGGPAQWGEPIATTSTLSTANAAYVVDTIGTPDSNPWGSRIKPGGMDFFKDGRLAVCTYSGDVWIVSGIDATLQHVTWKRFAAGLYETLGLKVVDDQIYVLGRDQITLLHDLNNDGEADFYENFNNDQVAAVSYHAFAFDLQTDSSGNFYYPVCGNLVDASVRLHGVMIKVSKDGERSEVFARGFRAPNGTGMGPHDELVCSDNQGHWTPVDRINLVTKGGFYGYRGDPRLFKTGDAERLGFPATYDPPICWIPYGLDNSAGGEVWAAGNRWGPLDGHMLQTSYGKSILMEVLWEMVGATPQGAVVKLPLQFESGIMRARFNPGDGQLYLCGLKGWQTNARHEGCLQRVRYTAKPANVPVGLHVKHDGIELTFSDKLDPTTANDPDSYDVEQWNYRYQSIYGSPELKVSDPTKQGHDPVPVRSVKLQPDGRTVFLQIDHLQPVMQMAIQCKLDGANGLPVEWEIDNTINKIPEK